MKEYVKQLLDGGVHLCIETNEQGLNWIFNGPELDETTLTRCYFQIALESCDYHIAGLNNKRLSREYVRQAATTRRLCRTLYVSLNVTPYENDMSEVLSRMSEYIGE